MSSYPFRFTPQDHRRPLLGFLSKKVHRHGSCVLVYTDPRTSRRRIEEEYITSLRKLHREANVVDASFDSRAEPTPTRAAWDILREGLEREASTREAFVSSLDIDVIKPLATLKETGDQTRKRIEKNLRNSAADYADHAENTISKLQQAYLKKYPPVDHSHSTTSLQQVPSRRFGVNLFRNRRELDRAEFEEPVLEDDCRKAVRLLNIIRLTRAENLEDGYNCLEDLVFRTTVKGVLVKYLEDMIKAYYDLAMGTKPGVGQALRKSDGSGLAGSFRRAFALSIPPLTLYRDYRSSGYSNLIFGVPLADPTANQYYAPNIIGMCIAEVERRGLNTNKIYSLGSINGAEVLQLRRRIECEKTFSFSSSDNIHSVAKLLELYLWDLPEPLIRLSLREFRQYGQNKARYTENDFSLLRSVIRELPPVHRETLGRLSRHLSVVASYSAQNGMTAKALASQFCYAVFRGSTIVEGYVYLKDSLMEDLIQNADTLFDEPLSPPAQPSTPPGVRISVDSHSSLFGSTLFADSHVMGPEFSPSARSSSTVLPSYTSVDGHSMSPPRIPQSFFPSPLLLSPTSSSTLTNGSDLPEPEPVVVVPEANGSTGSAVRPLPHTPPPLPLPPTFATYQQLPQHSPYPQALITHHQSIQQSAI
ncbi:hypothetical protein EDB87DRAFT_986754 [Lactarius vividus]|nr:hypothetical protein EDB87DRAFT_986754 [Lactarius vividus]